MPTAWNVPRVVGVINDAERIMSDSHTTDTVVNKCLVAISSPIAKEKPLYGAFGASNRERY